jgi:diguanylate cyclase (GGDEF)-like protein/PAS domain S-box-containing protein
MLHRLTQLLRRPLVAGLCAFFLSVVISAFIIWRIEQVQQQAARADAQNLAQNHAFLIRDSLDQALALNYALASLIRIEQGSRQHFESFARELLPFYPSVSHLSISPGGVISHVYPLAGNERSLGFNQLQDEAQKQEVKRTLGTGQLTLAGPLELVQGGLGVVGRLPVFLDNATETHHFWGFTNVVIRIPSLLQSAQLGQLASRGMVYKLWRIQPNTGEEQIIARGKGSLVRPVDQELSVPNGSWTLSIAPAGGWINFYDLAARVLVALLLCALVGLQSGLMVYLQRRKDRLEAAVTQHTQELSTAKENLEAILDAVPDLLFEIDAEGVIQSYHSNRQGIFSQPNNAFIQHNFREFLSSEAAAVVAEALAEAGAKGSAQGYAYSVDAPEGERVYELSVARKYQQLGAKLCFVVLSRNITERKQAEEDLRIAATAFEASEGMLITDPSGNILRVNNAFCEITGFSAEDVIGKNPRILKSGRHDVAFYQAMWKAIILNGSWQGEIWNRRRCGEVFPEWLTITAVKNELQQITHYVSTLTDITDRKADEARIHRLAFFDPLTQLPNRSLLRDRLEQAVVSSQREQSHGALLFIDLDDFKSLNDNRGHHIGDLLLIAVAKRLLKSVREQDTVARLGGDEFLVVLEQLDDDYQQAARQAQQVGDKILRELNLAYDLEGQEYFNSSSIGVCLYSPLQRNIDELMKQADQAMYHAKAAGRNTLRFFDPSMQALTAQRFALQSELREALIRQQFQLYYQPQVDLRGKVIGAEALIRWRHPHKGMVPPLDFIPLAEESGLILPLGEWIIATACEQLLAWAKQPQTAHLSLSINVSARQFQHPDFVQQILTVLARTPIDPGRIILELTESMLVADQELIIEKMSQLKAHGIRFSLDDFGTGYSSLTYLKRLPINELKIDKSFVNDILTNTNGAAIAVMIIHLAQSMDLDVIAEGVETRAQFEWLREQGCHLFQGYYFGRPVAASGFSIELSAELVD